MNENTEKSSGLFSISNDLRKYFTDRATTKAYYARFEPIREISLWKNQSHNLEKEMKSMEDFLLKIFKGN